MRPSHIVAVVVLLLLPVLGVLVVEGEVDGVVVGPCLLVVRYFYLWSRRGCAVSLVSGVD